MTDQSNVAPFPQTSAQRQPDAFIDIILVVAIIVWVTMIILVLAFVKIPDKNMPLFAALASGGILGTLGTLIGYRWGTSKSSESKSVALNTIATKAANG
jgi:hypothetical protein